MCYAMAVDIAVLKFARLVLRAVLVKNSTIVRFDALSGCWYVITIWYLAVEPGAFGTAGISSLSAECTCSTDTY